ncbi:MAG: DMT family transporter [Pseudobdellovibrio sp.]
MFYFISCSVIWGLTWAAIKYQFNSVDANAAVFYRFIFSSFILFAFIAVKKLPLRFSKKDHFYFMAQGFFMFCLNYNLTYWAEELAPSALVALAFTALIYFNLFGGKIFLRLPINAQVLYGALVSFLGMGLIAFNELAHQELHPTSFLGFFISLVATLSASAGNLVSIRNREMKIPIASNNAWGMLYGSGLSLLFCLISNKSMAVHNVDQAFIWSFVYLSLFGTVLSFGAYLKLIETMGPSKAAFTSVVSPVIAVAASMLLENLTLNVALVIGILFCILGNIIALTPHLVLKIKKYVH